MLELSEVMSEGGLKHELVGLQVLFVGEIGCCLLKVKLLVMCLLVSKYHLIFVFWFYTKF